MAHEHSRTSNKTLDKTLDKGRIRRQTGGGQEVGGQEAGSGGPDQDHAAAGHGLSRRDGENAAIITASRNRCHAGTREKREKKEKKKAAALFLGRDSRGPDERLQARPTAVRLSPWERKVRVMRRPTLRLRSLGGRRGPIVKFTRDARRRLIRELYSITGLCQHVVLTYPGTFPRRGDEAKTHLRALCRWVKRLGLGGVWVMEFQDRGAPHFHLLLNGHLDAETARAKWVEIIGASAALPSSCALRVEPIYDQHRIRSYVAKESTKEVPREFSVVGKFYGVFGPVMRIPTVDCVSETGLPYLIRALRTLDRKRRERRGWKRRRDSGRWSHSFGQWNNSEMKAINALIKWANGQ